MAIGGTNSFTQLSSHIFALLSVCICAMGKCVFTFVYIYIYVFFQRRNGRGKRQLFYTSFLLPPHSVRTSCSSASSLYLLDSVDFSFQRKQASLEDNNVLLFFDLLFSRNITRSFLSHTYQTTFLSHCYFQVHFPPPCSHSYFFPSSPSARPVRELAPNWSWFPGHGEGQWEKVNGKCHVSQASRRHTPNSALIGFFLADSHYQD